MAQERIVLDYYRIGPPSNDGIKSFENMSAARAFGLSLPPGEELVMNRGSRLDLLTHVRYVSREPARDPEPFSDAAPDQKTVRTLEATQAQTQDQWDALVTEHGGLHELLRAAVDSGDTAAITATRTRMGTIGTDIALAEISFLKARIQVLYGQKAVAKAQRADAAAEWTRVGPESNYPHGKDAAETARLAYMNAKYIPDNSAINQCLSRIQTLTKQLST